VGRNKLYHKIEYIAYAQTHAHHHYKLPEIDHEIKLSDHKFIANSKARVQSTWSTEFCYKG